MRELAVQAKKNGWVIMLLHFSNAFNTVERNLMLRLVTAHCPKMTKLTYRLYEQEPHLNYLERGYSELVNGNSTRLPAV